MFLGRLMATIMTRIRLWFLLWFFWFRFGSVLNRRRKRRDRRKWIQVMLRWLYSDIRMWLMSICKWRVMEFSFNWFMRRFNWWDRVANNSSTIPIYVYEIHISNAICHSLRQLPREKILRRNVRIVILNLLSYKSCL